MTTDVQNYLLVVNESAFHNETIGCSSGYHRSSSQNRPLDSNLSLELNSKSDKLSLLNFAATIGAIISWCCY